MNEVKLYFVGFWKHGRIQHLVEGPFLTFEHAEETITSMGDKGWNVSQLAIGSVTLPFTLVEE